MTYLKGYPKRHEVAAGEEKENTRSNFYKNIDGYP
jgi:hypothetical protein